MRQDPSYSITPRDRLPSRLLNFELECRKIQSPCRTVRCVLSRLSFSPVPHIVPVNNRVTQVRGLQRRIARRVSPPQS